jgi:hypothetical protein
MLIKLIKIAIKVLELANKCSEDVNEGINHNSSIFLLQLLGGCS